VTVGGERADVGADLLALLTDLTRSGVSVRLAGEAGLEVRAPRGHVTPELRARLGAQKPALLDWLARAGGDAAASALELVRPDPGTVAEPFPPSDLQMSFLMGGREGMEHHVRPHQYLEFDFPEMDVARFQAAVDGAIARQRDNIVTVDGDMMLRRVDGPVRLEVGVSDRTASPDPDAAAAEVRERMQRQELPLHEWPWMQLHVSTYAGGRARLHVNNNNFFSDALGTLRLLEDILRRYDEPGHEPPPLEISYRDCVLALAALEESPRGRASQRYWDDRLAGLPDAPAVPLLPGADTRERSRLSRRELRLTAQEWSEFQRRAARHGLTPSNALYAAYAEVLSGWSGSEHFLLNNMITHRLPFHPQVGEVLGNFASLYPLEVDWRGVRGFAGRAGTLQRQVLADVEQTYWSGVKVLQQLNHVRRSPGRAVCPFAIGSALGAEPIDRPVHSLLETPQVLLDCELFGLKDGGLWVVWDAIESMFPTGLIEDMHAGFRDLLHRLVATDDAWERDTGTLLPAGEQARRAELNRPAGRVPAGLLHDAVAARAADAADGPAVVAGNVRLTHGRLHRRSGRLAADLVAAGVRPGDLVGIALPKGWRQPVAVHAALRAGGAYVPIDPSWPAERLRYVLADTGARAVITDSAHAGALAGLSTAEILAVPEDDGPPRPQPLPDHRQDPGDLAYVIYTSGSTGRPKGAMLDHRGPLNTVADINRRFGVGPADRIFGISSLCFDLSVYDVFGAAAAGATLVLPTGEERDPAGWLELSVREGVTVWNSVPALMELLVEEAESAGVRLPGLRLVLLSGDWVPVSLPDRIRRVAPGATVVSLGGATEASIWSIAYPVEDVDPGWPSVPYGRPLDDQSWFVLDAAGRDAPTWVTGHLYIGGVGLALGYLNDPVRTDASFVRHPRTGERLYRTGDLGRYLPSGDLEFLGRADHQVKIQGFRVEPGEIEHALLDHPQVRQAVVTVRPSGSGKQLTAHVVAAGPPVPGPEDLRRFLAARLPAYLVPDDIHLLDGLPLSANGKVDRSALAAVPTGPVDRRRAHVPPRTPTEVIVADVWRDVLGLDQVGAEDDFFEIGGQSFAALRVVSHLGRRLGRRVQLGLLLEHRTVAGFAGALDSASPSASPVVRIGGPADRGTLVLVHPAGGSVLAYRGLGERLGRCLVALQAGDGEQTPDSVPALAAHYLQALADAGEPPPRLVGGWSSGAVIAHELAAQLERRGTPVQGVLVLDAPAPVERTDVPELTALLWFLEDLDLGLDLVAAADRLAAVPEQDRTAVALGLAAGHDQDGLRATYQVFRRVVAACNAYRPGRIAADIAVVRAEDGVVGEFAGHPFGDRPDWGWSTLTDGRTVTATAPGSHHTLLVPRRPDRLAGAIDDLLRRLGPAREPAGARGGMPR
jgi:pyochelin synthetase